MLNESRTLGFDGSGVTIVATRTVMCILLRIPQKATNGYLREEGANVSPESSPSGRSSLHSPQGLGSASSVP